MTRKSTWSRCVCVCVCVCVCAYFCVPVCVGELSKLLKCSRYYVCVFSSTLPLHTQVGSLEESCSWKASSLIGHHITTLTSPPPHYPHIATSTLPSIPPHYPHISTSTLPSHPHHTTLTSPPPHYPHIPPPHYSHITTTTTYLQLINAEQYNVMTKSYNGSKF